MDTPVSGEQTSQSVPYDGSHGGTIAGWKPPMQQAVAWQLALNRAMAGDVTLTAVAQGARAWCEVERLKREIRMKPKPRPVDVSAQMKPKKRSEMSEMEVKEE